MEQVRDFLRSIRRQYVCGVERLPREILDCFIDCPNVKLNVNDRLDLLSFLSGKESERYKYQRQIVKSLEHSETSGISRQPFHTGQNTGGDPGEDERGSPAKNLFRPMELRNSGEDRLEKILKNGKLGAKEMEVIHEQLYRLATTREDRCRQVWNGVHSYHRVWRGCHPHRNIQWQSHLKNHVQTFPEDLERLRERWGEVVVRVSGGESVEFHALSSALWGLSVIGGGKYDDHMGEILHLSLNVLQRSAEREIKLLEGYPMERQDAETWLVHCFRAWKPASPHLQRAVRNLWWKAESKSEIWDNPDVAWGMLFRVEPDETRLMEAIRQRRNQNTWYWGCNTWEPQEAVIAEMWRAFCTECLVDHIHQTRKVPIVIRARLWQNLFALDPHHPALTQLLELYLPSEKDVSTLEAIAAGLKKNGIPNSMSETTRQLLEEKIVDRTKGDRFETPDVLGEMALLLLTGGKEPETPQAWPQRRTSVKSFLRQTSHGHVLDKAGRQLVALPADQWNYKLLEPVYTEIQWERFSMGTIGTKRKILQWLSQMVMAEKPLSDQTRLPAIVLDMLETETDLPVVAEILSLGNRVATKSGRIEAVKWWETLRAKEQGAREQKGDENASQLELVLQTGRMEFLVLYLEKFFHERAAETETPDHDRFINGGRIADDATFFRYLRAVIHIFQEPDVSNGSVWGEIWETWKASQLDADVDMAASRNNVGEMSGLEKTGPEKPESGMWKMEAADKCRGMAETQSWSGGRLETQGAGKPGQSMADR